MADTYVIVSCVIIGTQVICTGSVNGFSVIVSTDKATLNTFPNVTTQVAFFESLMLAAYNAANPVAVPGVPGTYVA